MYNVVPSLELLFTFRILHGIGFAFANTACLTLASFIVEDSLKSYSVSMVTAFNAIGLILGPLLGTLGTFFFDIPTTFTIVSIIIVISFLFAFYASKNFKLGTADVVFHKIRVNDFLLLKEKWFIVSTLSYFAYALIYGTIISYIPPFIKKFGLNDYNITTLFLIFFILSLLSRIILVKRTGLEFLKKMLIFSLSISIFMFGLVGFSNYLETFVLEFTLIGLGHGFVYPITALFISKNAPTKKLYMINTVYFTSFDFGNAAGPLIASLIIPFLPYHFVFLSVSIISCIIFSPTILYLKHL